MDKPHLARPCRLAALNIRLSPQSPVKHPVLVCAILLTTSLAGTGAAQTLTVTNGQIFTVASSNDLAGYTNVVVQAGGTLNVTGTNNPLAGQSVTIAGRGTSGTNQALFFNSAGGWTNTGTIQIDGSAGIHLGSSSRTVVTTTPLGELSSGASLWLAAGHTNAALTFNTPASFTGGLTVSSAVYFPQSDNALAGGHLTITNNGGFRVSARDQTLPGDLLLHSGRVWNSSTGLRTIRANNFIVQEGVIGTTNNGRLTLADKTNTATPFVKSGAGTLTLRAKATYSGGTDIRGGTILIRSDSVGGDDLLPTAGSVSISNGATLDLSTFNQTLAGLTGAGTVTGTGGTLTISNSSGNNTFSGTLIGTVGLRKLGTGSLTLSGTNTANGPMDVSGGTLIVNGLVAGPLTVGANGTLSGSGSIGGTATIRGLHRLGQAAGIQTFSSNLAYDGGTVEWVLTDNTSGNRGTDYVGIDVSGALDFTSPTTMVVYFTGAVNWDDEFWDSERTGSAGWRIFQSGTPILRPENLRLEVVSIDSRGGTLVRGRGEFTLHHDTASHAVYLQYRRPAGPGTSFGIR